MSMPKTPAILNDTTLCTGCSKCVEACRLENDLGPDRLMPQQRRIDELSDTRYTTIEQRPGGHFVRHQCRHCLNPACASACLVAAISRTPEGAVVCDYSKCIGCRYCLLSCPFNAPRYQWEKRIPWMVKCTLCRPRLMKGREPACTEACPYGATIFGERDELLAIAHQRIKDNPEKYKDRVFGEHEVGGTAVLHISDIDLDFLGWAKELPGEALPELTYQSLKKVPPVALGMAGLMAGTYWIIGRRMKMQELAAADGEAGATGEDTKAG